MSHGWSNNKPLYVLRIIHLLIRVYENCLFKTVKTGPDAHRQWFSMRRSVQFILPIWNGPSSVRQIWKKKGWSDQRTSSSSSTTTTITKFGGAPKNCPSNKHGIEHAKHLFLFPPICTRLSWGLRAHQQSKILLTLHFIWRARAVRGYKIFIYYGHRRRTKYRDAQTGWKPFSIAIQQCHGV